MYQEFHYVLIGLIFLLVLTGLGASFWSYRKGEHDYRTIFKNELSGPLWGIFCFAILLLIPQATLENWYGKPITSAKDYALAPIVKIISLFDGGGYSENLSCEKIATFFENDELHLNNGRNVKILVVESREDLKSSIKNPATLFLCRGIAHTTGGSFTADFGVEKVKDSSMKFLEVTAQYIPKR